MIDASEPTDGTLSEAIDDELQHCIDLRLALEDSLAESKEYLSSINEWKRNGFELTHEGYYERCELERLQTEQQLLKEEEERKNPSKPARSPTICLAAMPPPDITMMNSSNHDNKAHFESNTDPHIHVRHAPVVLANNHQLPNIASVFSKVSKGSALATKKTTSAPSVSI